MEVRQEVRNMLAQLQHCRSQVQGDPVKSTELETLISKLMVYDSQFEPTFDPSALYPSFDDSLSKFRANYDTTLPMSDGQIRQAALASGIDEITGLNAIRRDEKYRKDATVRSYAMPIFNKNKPMLIELKRGGFAPEQLRQTIRAIMVNDTLFQIPPEYKEEVELALVNLIQSA